MGALALLALAAFGLVDAGRVRDVMANGVETTAAIDGSAGGIRLGPYGDYLIDLTWRDAKGSVRQSKHLKISSVYAQHLISGSEPPSVLIKYLADAPERAPVIVRQAAFDLEDNRLRIMIGVIGGGLCTMGAAFLIWRDVRRGRQSRDT
jgi:hypothetical protein